MLFNSIVFSFIYLLFFYTFQILKVEKQNKQCLPCVKQYVLR